MSAEFSFVQPGAEGGGGNPSHGKKKKFNSLYLYIGGAIVIMLYVMFLKRQPATTTDTTSGGTIDPSTVGYPSNSVDYQAAVQNQSDILGNQMQNTLTQFASQLQSDYGTQLTNLSNKMDVFQTQLDTLNAHPNPDTTVPASGSPTVSMPATTTPEKVNQTVTPTTYYNNGQNPNLGTMSTGVYKTAADAAKVADTIAKQFGPNVRVVGTSGNYRVQADMPTQKAADDLAAYVKKQGLASVAYGTKVG